MIKIYMFFMEGEDSVEWLVWKYLELDGAILEKQTV